MYIHDYMPSRNLCYIVHQNDNFKQYKIKLCFRVLNSRLLIKTRLGIKYIENMANNDKFSVSLSSAHVNKIFYNFFLLGLKQIISS